MLDTEEKELLIRLDERTANIWRVVEEVKLQVENQNGVVDDVCKKIDKASLLINLILGFGIPALLTLGGWILHIEGMFKF